MHDAAPTDPPPRRAFLKVGAGFSLALLLGTLLPACNDTAKAPVQGLRFLRAGDVDLFTALAPAVVAELGQLDAPTRAQTLAAMLQVIDDTLVAMDLGSQGELRKLLALLALAPLRRLLTGVGPWPQADAAQMQAFLARWRASRFATLNAGAGVLVKLAASGFFLLPAAWPAAGYPGPLPRMYRAVNA